LDPLFTTESGKAWLIVKKARIPTAQLRAEEDLTALLAPRSALSGPKVSTGMECGLRPDVRQECAKTGRN